MKLFRNILIATSALALAVACQPAQEEGKGDATIGFENPTYVYKESAGRVKLQVKFEGEPKTYPITFDVVVTPEGGLGLDSLVHFTQTENLKYMGNPDAPAYIEFDLKAVPCDGIEECHIALLKKSKNALDGNFIEGMACIGGCIGGAGCLTHGAKNKAEVDKYGREALEKNISDIDEINRKIRANLDREKAETEAEGYAKQYETLSQKIEEIRTKRTKLLDNADMPLPDLSVVNGELTYKGYKWDGMSGSDQLKISTAIVRKLNPECGFVLLDKLEQMDTDTLSEFGKWLEKQGLQAIATRVSTGDECSIIIEDGYVKKEEVKHEKPAAVAWKPGEF